MISTYSTLDRGSTNFRIRRNALIAAMYTGGMSIVVAIFCGWRLVVNARQKDALQDVYWGVQISYLANLGCQLASVFFSTILLAAVNKENAPMIVPWVVGTIAFLAMEAVGTVYSNVLRDHVNHEFDTLCKVEGGFLIFRGALNCVALHCVLRVYRALKTGVRFGGPEQVEL
ncbi:uncharacterized protein LOC117647006 [Thrips palmi]|uniref:Uncharacterized protein LOC117647006 n=1 Tax=Thrips palmi TaxID=161013 RepID=A0A6P8Z2X0_THRPL|nr:uncharacterized protein LOC117647006 [Thrips palmi]XP_034244376.1 uncharacterized protein LOC117647006 [Thrips palmi]